MPLTKGTSTFDSPNVSPDGEWIAYVSDGHIYKMTIEGGTPTQLTFSNATDFSPAWSPDGKQIAFGSNEGGAYRVWIVDADGSNRRQSADTQLGRNEDQQVTWSPGRRIVYQNAGNRNLRILDPQTGEQRSLVGKEGGYPFTPKYSPDGMRVVVCWRHRLALEWGLWVISLIDNSETRLLGGDLGPGHLSPAGWSQDGSTIYAYTGNRMMSIPAAGGTPRTVFTAPADIAGASVSADGKKIVYSVAETKSDVWIVDNFDPAYRK